MDQARALDRTYGTRGPVDDLHCIPVVLKHNVDTTDMPTTGGSANLAVLSIGTDTLGSIRGPVQANSLAEVKPTSGLVSGTGVIPFSLTFDAAGPMTRTVTDAARMLNAEIVTGIQAPASITPLSGQLCW